MEGAGRGRELGALKDGGREGKKCEGIIWEKEEES